MKKILLSAIIVLSLLTSCTKSDPNLVTISGKITNPIGNNVAFNSADTSFSTTMNEDGSFEITFSLDSAMYLNFNHGPEHTAMYVKPGDVINLTIDTEQFDETITYTGSPASTFLAKKYLMEEDGDFFGDSFYLNDSAQYSKILDKFREKIINELAAIQDSLFINNEMSDIDDKLEYYKSRQLKISKYPEDARIYFMKFRDISKEFDFYYLIDSLDGDEFNQKLQEYSDSSMALLNNVEDDDFVSTNKGRIERTISMWKERKIAHDNAPKEGEAAIDFTYPDKNGEEISLSSFKGSLVYVDVWATWCGPCLGEIPALKKLEEDYHGKNITFLSVSVDEDKDSWMKMVDEKDLGGIQLWADGWSQVTKDYAIFGIPRFMLISSDGIVISPDAPRPSSDKVRDLIDNNL